MRLAAADGGGEREWSLVWVPLPGAGEPSALLVVEDATEVLRSQRLLAWAEMARMIAHEIKNPLTPIRLSTEHMMEVYQPRPRALRPRLRALHQQHPDPGRRAALDRLRVLGLQLDPADRSQARPTWWRAWPTWSRGTARRRRPGCRVELRAPRRPEIVARFDAKLLQRAVRNLIENALRATAAGGGRGDRAAGAHDGFARIAVLDSGPGVPPDLLPRIFDPYFSTHDTGTGLGLPIARRIAEEHGGGITARNRPEGGLEVVVTLPV